MRTGFVSARTDRRDLRAGGPRGGASYEEKYAALLKDFFAFQQTVMTPEEEEFDKACLELEELSRVQMEEVESLEAQNSKLQAQVEDVSAILGEYRELQEAEARLLELRRSLDRAR